MRYDIIAPPRHALRGTTKSCCSKKDGSDRAGDARGDEFPKPRSFSIGTGQGRLSGSNEWRGQDRPGRTPKPALLPISNPRIDAPMIHGSSVAMTIWRLRQLQFYQFLSVWEGEVSDMCLSTSISFGLVLQKKKLSI